MLLRRVTTLALLALYLGFTAQIAQAADTANMAELNQQLEQHTKALIQDGFRMTLGVSLKNQNKPSGLTRLELVFPPAADETTLSVWFQSLGGEVAVRLSDSAGQPVLAWSGRKGEFTTQRQMPAGRYVLEFNAAAASGGLALWGVKGPAIFVPKMDAARFSVHEAKPAAGFHWPYLLLLPSEIKSPHLLVAPNNSGFVSEDESLLTAAATAELAGHAELAEQLGVVLLVPTFPRPAQGDDNLYLHALTRESLQTQVPTWARVDLQLGAMVNDAREHLRTTGRVTLNQRLLLWGFSASGSFVNRFAFLHPEQVLAVASGSPGGFPLLPLASEQGEVLRYPVGVHDLATLTGRPLDLPAVRHVAWHLYMGDADLNDAVVYRDSFSAADEALIFKLYGSTPLARWARIAQIYQAQGLQAQFQLYPGETHRVTPAMAADTARFFQAQLRLRGQRLN